MNMPLLKLSVCLGLCAFLALPACALDRPPNVIIILADDLGAADLHCYGAQDLLTPNLDALAARGMRFTNFYSAAAVCSPSRAALLTGRCPARNGMEGNAGAVGDSGGLDPREMTLAEILKGHGYATALIGKWHLGSDAEHNPLAQGFDTFTGFLGGCIDNWSHFFYWAGPNRHDLWRTRDGKVEEWWPDGEFFPDLMAEEAETYIKAKREKPFFLYYALNSPHYPVQPRKDLRAKFKHLGEPRAAYAAWVVEMDRGVGRVLNAVRESGIERETIIMFLSDHGHSVEERGNFGGGNSGGLRGSKFGFFEGGIKVPFIVSYPGKVRAGSVCDTLAWEVDILPTILDQIAAPLPSGVKLDGTSLVSPLTENGLDLAPRTLFWKAGDQWAAREGRWKVIVNPPETPGGDPPNATGLFLSDLEDDPSETRNQTASRPKSDIRLRIQGEPDSPLLLQAKYQAWLDSIRSEKRP